ncbi:MAG: HEPN domain-containing protein [Ardenticatenaceae bacterium]|nr:HEPN domain-containing protein [Ardenticatenaceae bacterium]
MMVAKREEIRLYMAEAQQMLQVATDTLALGHLSTAVNRSYYAVFYAASALLQSIDEVRVKHHGVFSAFGQYFIKSGLWADEFSDIYKQLLSDRESADYELLVKIPQAQVEQHLQNARHFAAEAETWLKKAGWL